MRLTKFQHARQNALHQLCPFLRPTSSIQPRPCRKILSVRSRNAAAHPGNRQVYSEVSELIENLDPKDVRPVIDAIQHLPKSARKKYVYVDAHRTLGGRRSRGALDYAQTENAAEKGWLVAVVVGTWAEHDSAAAMAWVTQTPPGSERNGALQSLVSVSRRRKIRKAHSVFASSASGRPNRSALFANLQRLGQC